MPKTPDEWLAVTTPPEKTKGVLKLFLGYAPGVGKTYSMLTEAIRRHSRGEDVVVGVVETHGRKGIAELVPQLEAVPRKKIEYKGTLFEEMDVDAIVARRPAVALVDELAHTNIRFDTPGLSREHASLANTEQSGGAHAVPRRA